MSKELWSDVDRYLEKHLIRPDPVFRKILENSERAELPPIAVSACQGKFLELMVRFLGARRVLELGTLGGYSTAWLARGLTEKGIVVTIEADPGHAAVAGENLDEAGVSGVVDLLVGDAIPILEQMARDNAAPFDLIFLDAEKTEYSAYLDAVLPLSRPGAMILADNVIRDGAVIETSPADSRVVGVQEFLEKVARNPRLEATTIQTVGAKGYDGFTVIRVTED